MCRRLRDRESTDAACGIQIPDTSVSPRTRLSTLTRSAGSGAQTPAAYSTCASFPGVKRSENCNLSQRNRTLQVNLLNKSLLPNALQICAMSALVNAPAASARMHVMLPTVTNARLPAARCLGSSFSHLRSSHVVLRTNNTPAVLTHGFRVTPPRASMSWVCL